jgi:hypothetical protein
MNNQNINNTDYVAFQATSVRDLIIKKLNEGQIFTDQNYQGSNLAAIIDVISYSFSTLLYYLNKTSSESMFSESQIYENMNRIVKLLNYNPIGKITQSVDFNITSTALPVGNYVIPRYSYISIGGTEFSLSKDILFTNTSTGTIQLQNLNSDLFLYEGRFTEYPIYTANGISNEILFLNLGNNTFVDHFNIFVYVYNSIQNKWEKWEKSENLFLNNSTDKVFELRYNPNKNYEIKFGDNINGKQLQTGDKVLLFYLNINTNSRTLSINSLSANNFSLYNSVFYNQILNDTLPQKQYALNTEQLRGINITNNYPSNPYQDEESVESIRKNAPKNFSFQQRLVTANDYQNFISKNFNNVFSNIYVVNNDDYLKGHIKYLYNIGLNSPQLEGRILYNQIKFANSCNFNNVYFYAVPLNDSQLYITSSQKEYILSEIENNKTLTAQVVPLDPVYMSFDFYVKSPYKNPNVSDLNVNKLNVYKSPNSRKSSSGILSDVITVIRNYFNRQNSSLGQYIDINELSTLITNIDGVESIKTYRSDIDTYVEGLSFLVWNYVYPSLDSEVYSQNLQLGYYQYPLFNNIDNLASRINIVEPTGIIQITDF